MVSCDWIRSLDLNCRFPSRQWSIEGTIAGRRRFESGGWLGSCVWGGGKLGSYGPAWVGGSVKGINQREKKHFKGFDV